MKTGTALATALFALASFPLWAQQPSSPASQPTPATQQNPPGAMPATPSTPAAAPETSAVEMSPVNGELLSKLDSKTAKKGDDVVVQTKASVKTADGTEIPKGSKLMGHVLAVQPSEAGANSQVVLQFDHLELKGGQSVTVHSQIQSIAPPDGAASASGPAAIGGPATGTGTAARASSSPTPSGTTGSRASGVPQDNSSAPGAATAGTGVPAAGTVVARSGQIAVQTTSIPGVLLANNAPGQQDPRMAQVSSILLGAKKDIQLDGGTQMVIGVAAAGGGTR